MRKLSLTFFVPMIALLFGLSSNAGAQTFTISGGTSGSHLYNLVYTWYQAPRTQRMATHIPASQLAAGGMVPGATITSLDLERLTGNTLALPAGANMKIYLENQPASSLDLGAGSLTWATVIPNAIMVFDGDPSVNLDNSPGWKNFPFGTGTGAAPSFTYSGGAIVVYSDYIHTTAIGGSTAIPMMYATAAQGLPAPNDWTSNSTKYSSTSTTTPSATLASSTANHPHIKLNYSTAPCTSPPAISVATSSATGSVCPGTPVLLNLTSYTPGLGQTYLWEESTTPGGPFSPISTAAASPMLTVNPSTTMYYRCAVTCNSFTTYSSEVLLTVSTLFPGGTYTINSAQATGGTNFQSFADALSAISCGIAGGVTFNVASGSGPYNEQLVIPAVAGASATTPIVINGNGATIQAAPVSATRAIILLDGADHVTISGLTLVGQDVTYGWGIHLTNGADHNTITNCTINMDAVTSTGQSNSGGIIVSGSATSVTTDGSASYNTISNNTITGGYQGIIINGGTGSLNAAGNVITGNDIKDYYANGLEMTNTDGVIIANNQIHRPNRLTTTTSSGIELGDGCKNSVVNANRIYDTHVATTATSGTAYGIYLTACDAPAGSENKITNNLIYNFGSLTGTQYGLYNSSSDGAHYYHNTVVLNNAASTSGLTRGFYQLTLASNIILKNNIFYISRGGTGIKYCLYFGTTTSSIVSDHNDLVMLSTSGTNGTGYYGAGFSDLAQWKTANSGAYDQGSTDADPAFASASTGNLTPTNGALDNLGTPVNVTTDLLGTPRNPSLPDIGALEFTGGPLSVKLQNFTARAINQDVNLSWAVTGEENMDSYVVERSLNGQQFDAVGSVAAAAQISYGYKDADVMNLAKDVIYYRLKMTEKAGAYAYSGIATVKVSGQAGDVSIYPNPFSHQVTVQLHAEKAGNASLVMRDVQGRIVTRQSNMLNTGSNEINIHGLEKLPHGVYHLGIEYNGNQLSRKIVK